MSQVGVMHVSDTLDPGGLERVSVTIANALPRAGYRVYLCTTRRDGALARLVASHVGRLRLGRRGRFDVKAIRLLTAYIRQHEIALLHAHGTALFIAAIASLLVPGLKVIWHDHFGAHGTERRPRSLYWMAARRVCGVIAVTEDLAEWSRQSLHVPPERVWCVPNFASEPGVDTFQLPDLPGTAGFRIACVANLRPQKDHRNLVLAMKDVMNAVPEAHLLLLGGASDTGIAKSIEEEIKRSGLSSSITWLGPRDDVPSVLRSCDIGVLSSASEGFPLALIEYGMAGLAVVATRVGKCEEVLDNGSAGLLVPPSAPQALGGAIVSLLQSPERRQVLGGRLGKLVREIYSADRAIGQVLRIYGAVLRPRDQTK